MAYLDASVLNDFQAREGQDEFREQKFGLIAAVKDSTPFVDYVPPSTQELLRTISGSRAAKIPVLKDQAVTVVTTPGFNNIPQNLPESDVFSFTAFDVFTGFRLYPASYENNQLDMAWEADQRIRKVLHAAAQTIEGIFEQQALARRTQVLDYTTQISQGDGTYTFNTSDDQLNIAKAAVKETMFYNLQSLMMANKLEGNYRLVTSPSGLVAQIVEAFKFGPNNDKNLLWNQLAFPMDRRYETHSISAGSDIFQGFFFRDGALGVYENFPYDFRNGTRINGKEWSMSDVELPYTRMRANVYVNTEATEATSLIDPNTDTNLIMTHWEEMAMWFRFYVVYRHNSDLANRANDVVKVVGLTT